MTISATEEGLFASQEFTFCSFSAESVNVQSPRAAARRALFTGSSVSRHSGPNGTTHRHGNQV